MNWQDVTGRASGMVAHWQRLGQFRARHPAMGNGRMTTLSLTHGDGFVRDDGQDRVMVIWAGKRE